MQPLDIRPDHLRLVLDILRHHVPTAEVSVFGSRAKWLARDTSDLDLCIRDAVPLSFEQMAKLREAFEESNLPYKVDSVDWAVLSESFRKVVERDKVIIQDGQQARDMHSEWEVTTLGDFAPFSYGKSLPERDRTAGLYPVLSSAGVTGWHNYPLVKTAGVVIGRKGTVGSVTLSKSPFWVIDTAFYVADEPEKRDLYFTYYLLKTLGLTSMNSDSAVPGLNRDNAHSLSVRVPPLATQHSIASTLCALDDKIALLRETNTTLEAIAQALFKSWFVDFDPVRAKAEGRELEGITPEISTLFPSEFQDSELGEIPQGWTIQRLGDALELAYGKALKATDRISGTVPVYGSGGITGYHNQHLVAGPSVIVGRKGTVGSLYWEDRPFFPIDTVFYVKSKAPPLTFCYYLLRTLGLDSMNTDAAVPGLNRDNAYRLTYVMPTDEVFRAFDNCVTSLREKIFASSEEVRNLSEIRDALLPRLMSGKLRFNPIIVEKTPFRESHVN